MVFGVEKLVKSKLYELTSNRRIFTIDTHVGMVRFHLYDNHCSLLANPCITIPLANPSL